VNVLTYSVTLKALETLISNGQEENLEKVNSFGSVETVVELLKTINTVTSAIKFI
jgi:hypothetical protein